jgi:hypothetical protein
LSSTIGCQLLRILAAGELIGFGSIAMYLPELFQELSGIRPTVEGIFIFISITFIFIFFP